MTTPWRVNNPGGAWIRGSPEFNQSNIKFTAKFGDVFWIDGPMENDFHPFTVYIHKTMVVPDSLVPYISQWSLTANISTGDCGEAATLMLAQGAGIAKDKTVDDCVRLIHNEAGWSTGADLIELGTALGINLIQKDTLGDRCVVLINYGRVPVTQKQDVGFNGLHWVTVVSQSNDLVTYHDPDFWGNRTWEGANRTAHKADFNAWCMGVFIWKA